MWLAGSAVHHRLVATAALNNVGGAVTVHPPADNLLLSFVVYKALLIRLPHCMPPAHRCELCSELQISVLKFSDTVHNQPTRAGCTEAVQSTVSVVAHKCEQRSWESIYVERRMRHHIFELNTLFERE